MKHIKCDVKGCDYTASHATDYVKAMIGIHKAKIHGIEGKTAKYRKNYKPRNPEDVAETSEVQTKRPYTRKAPTQLVKFCPECGCDLHVVAVALNLRK